MDMHFEILKSVKLFEGCDEQLLIDLVLNLKPILFLPGQFVCKKGEVGKEMYIISSGLVQGRVLKSQLQAAELAFQHQSKFVVQLRSKFSVH